MTIKQICIALSLFIAPLVVHGGEHQEKLSECLLESTTKPDKKALVRWMFSAMAAHPDVSDMASITADERSSITNESAMVFEKLIASTCAAESRATILQEGMEAFSSSFEILGQTAMMELIQDKAVLSAISELNKHSDNEKILKALMTGSQ